MCYDYRTPTDRDADMSNETTDVRTLVSELITAVAKDEQGEGCDISGGLLGVNTSRWLVELAGRLRQASRPNSAVEKLPERWRKLAEGFRDGTDVGNAEGACIAVSANELEAAIAQDRIMWQTPDGFTSASYLACTERVDDARKVTRVPE